MNIGIIPDIENFHTVAMGISNHFPKAKRVYIIHLYDGDNELANFYNTWKVKNLRKIFEIEALIAERKDLYEKFTISVKPNQVKRHIIELFPFIVNLDFSFEEFSFHKPINVFEVVLSHFLKIHNHNVFFVTEILKNILGLQTNFEVLIPEMSFDSFNKIEYKTLKGFRTNSYDRLIDHLLPNEDDHIKHVYILRETKINPILIKELNNLDFLVITHGKHFKYSIPILKQIKEYLQDIPIFLFENPHDEIELQNYTPTLLKNYVESLIGKQITLIDAEKCRIRPNDEKFNPIKVGNVLVKKYSSLIKDKIRFIGFDFDGTLELENPKEFFLNLRSMFPNAEIVIITGNTKRDIQDLIKSGVIDSYYYNMGATKEEKDKIINFKESSIDEYVDLLVPYLEKIVGKEFVEIRGVDGFKNFILLRPICKRLNVYMEVYELLKRLNLLDELDVFITGTTTVGIVKKGGKFRNVSFNPISLYFCDEYYMGNDQNAPFDMIVQLKRPLKRIEEVLE